MIVEKLGESCNADAQLPREMRTAVSDAVIILDKVQIIHSKIYSDGSFAGDDAADQLLEDRIIGLMGTADGDAAIIAFFQYFDKNCVDGEFRSDGTPSKTVSLALDIPCSFAVQAMKAHDNNDPNAWSFAADAWYWLGVCFGICRAGNDSASSLVENSRKAALAGHAENHAIAKDLEDWHKANCLKFTSKDSMAEAATKVVPFKFRTARRHIGELAKTYPLHARGKPCM